MAEEEVAAVVADNENGLSKVDDALRAVKRRSRSTTVLK